MRCFFQGRDLMKTSYCGERQEDRRLKDLFRQGKT